MTTRVLIPALTDVPVLHSGIDTAVFLVGFGALAVASFAVAAVVSVRRRDPLALAACVGALVCALNEPIYDYLGKIVYAADSTTAYTAFGRHIPLFLVLGYVPWVGLLSYAVARLMARGVAPRRLYALALGSFASVVLVETLGNLAHAWSYYGRPPLKYLGVAPQMAPVPILCGLLLYVLGSRLRGWRRLWLVFVPTVALPAVYASAGWPMYLALHSDVPKVVQYLAGFLTLALCAAIVACAAAAARARALTIHGGPA
ncbi:MAG: hypothetical protein JWN32_774 [Solirubrobacterales bacterium]|nr:hypothetical protein [Solirubrobacterales bacterium]